VQKKEGTINIKHQKGQHLSVKSFQTQRREPTSSLGYRRNSLRKGNKSMGCNGVSLGGSFQKREVVRFFCWFKPQKEFKKRTIYKNERKGNAFFYTGGNVMLYLVAQEGRKRNVGGTGGLHKFHYRIELGRRPSGENTRRKVGIRKNTEGEGG